MRLTNPKHVGIHGNGGDAKGIAQRTTLAVFPLTPGRPPNPRALPGTRPPCLSNNTRQAAKDVGGLGIIGRPQTGGAPRSLSWPKATGIFEWRLRKEAPGNLVDSTSVHWAERMAGNEQLKAVVPPGEEAQGISPARMPVFYLRPHSLPWHI